MIKLFQFLARPWRDHPKKILQTIFRLTDIGASGIPVITTQVQPAHVIKWYFTKNFWRSRSLFIKRFLAAGGKMIKLNEFFSGTENQGYAIQHSIHRHFRKYKK